jgi:putative ABC transport system substrate-binding protein
MMSAPELPTRTPDHGAGRRRALSCTLAIAGWIAAGGARAQPRPDRPARVGILGMTSVEGYAPQWNALRRGLRELGRVEGRDLVFESRYADGVLTRLPQQAAELVAAGVDVIVTHGIPGTGAAKRATTTIPIVMAAVADPVGAGFVESYARPGGNVTGITFFAHEMAAKRVDLIREAMPGLASLGVLANARNPIYSAQMVEATRTAAASLGVSIRRFDAAEPAEFEAAFAEMAASRVQAVAVIEEAALNAQVAPIAALALRHRLPSIGTKSYCDAGGLVGYGADFAAMFHRAASLVDRILRGASPGELPVERPTRFELAVNERTARTLGATLPRSLLIQADSTVR